MIRETLDGFVIDGFKLFRISYCCPEQYNVFENDKQVAYLRLRHHYFSAEVPKYPGNIVYEANTVGDGCFNYTERDFHLSNAINAIKKNLNTTKFETYKFTIKEILNLQIEKYYNDENKHVCSVNLQDSCKFLGFKNFGFQAVCMLGEQVDLERVNDLGFIIPHEKCLLKNVENKL